MEDDKANFFGHYVNNLQTSQKANNNRNFFNQAKRITYERRVTTP